MWAFGPGLDGKEPQAKATRTKSENIDAESAAGRSLGVPYTSKVSYSRDMLGSDPQVLIFAVVILGTVISLLASLTTWVLSRAKHMRALEDLVRGSISTQELRLAEWQTTIKGILAEVEDFFDRSVKERKRAVFAQTKLEAANTEPQLSLDSMSHLSRADQLELVRQHFDGH